MQAKINSIVATTFLLLITLVTGCVKVQAPVGRPTSLPQDDLDQALVVVIDLSTSFEDEWSGKAYPFFQEMISRYYRGAIGSESRLLIGRLSETRDVIFWSGTPRQFQQDFPNEAVFLARLEAEQTTEDSPVFRSMIATLDHLEGLPRVGPSTKLTAVFLSDMYDHVDNRTKRRVESQEMLRATKRFTDDGGNLAMYYVPEKIVAAYRRQFKRAGIDPSRVWIETNDVSRPTIPDFH